MTPCVLRARRTRLWGAAGFLLIASGAACSRSPFAVVPVSGTVVLDGVPLAGGAINFQPIASGTGANAGPGSTARVNADGRYSLVTIGGVPGAVVGTHRVKIYSHSPGSPAKNERGPATQLERVPARYNYKSEVTFVVPPSGTDVADFKISTN